MEYLEPRRYMAVVAVPLDFETPTTGSVPNFKTDFGSIELKGFYETAIIDPDLASAGHGGTVFQSSPQSTEYGTGEINISGALGTSILFFYGSRGQFVNNATRGGFTGYTYTRSQTSEYGVVQPEAGDIFKQFNLNQDAPIGPQVLDGPLFGPSEVAIVTPDLTNHNSPAINTYSVSQDGAGYFNSFRWTSGTASGDVFDNTRPGSIQIDDVLLTVEPALDILKNSVRPYVRSDGRMVAQFAPVGTNGPVPLKDLAQSLGVDHFNWRQSILGYPAGPVQIFKFKNVDSNLKVLDLMAQAKSPITRSIRGDAFQAYYTNQTPADVSDDIPVEMVLATTPLIDPIPSPNEYYVALGADGSWNPVVLNGDSDGDGKPDYFYFQDSLPYYFDETPSVTAITFDGRVTQTTDSAWSRSLVDAKDANLILNGDEIPSQYSMMFHDKPSLPTGSFTGLHPYLKFQTELVGVKEDGTAISWQGIGTNFVWKSNATNAEGQYAYAAISNSAPAITAGGVFDIFVDDSAAPNVAPVATGEFVTSKSGTAVNIDVLSNDDNPDFGFLDKTSVLVTLGPPNGQVTVDPVTGIISYASSAGYVGVDEFRYVVKDDQGAVSNEATVSVRVDALVSWQNVRLATDVNDDGFTSPIDVLLIINYLNTTGAGKLPLPGSSAPPPPFLDVSGDEHASAIDALIIINALNTSEGEAEEKETTTALAASAHDEVLSSGTLFDAEFPDWFPFTNRARRR